MKLKNALENIHKTHEKDTLHPLSTPWGENLDPEHVWEEYPRPQMRRQNYHMLNGYWEYCFETQESGPSQKSRPSREVVPGLPFQAQGRILVPFSPESLLSGVGRQLLPEETLWYQRSVAIEYPYAPLTRCLLHFDAVDQEAEIFINGSLAARHLGGYLPFTLDITDYLTARNRNIAEQTKAESEKAEHAADSGVPSGSPADNAAVPSCKPLLLQVRVRDVSDTSWHARGKQALKRGGMFYTAQSGIWQSVWYEWVPENYILSMHLTPDYDTQSCRLVLTGSKTFSKISLFWDDNTAYPVTASERITDPEGNPAVNLTFSLPDNVPFQPWTPDTPHLYPLVIRADQDVIESYFAMRCFTVEKDENGTPRFCLNHSPLFLHGILDQGYWPDGLMTAPCDDAFVYDIRLAKSLGFNMIRKHIKIEPLRWYYHCDRLGMLVWQDMVNGGTAYSMPFVCYLPTLLPFIWNHCSDHHYRLFSRASKEGREEWLSECRETIRHLSNIPSIAVWVPFNEGWGQFDAKEVCAMIKKEDPTRPVDHASGWFDQGCGDFKSIHNYFRPLTVKKEPERACVISEYGGYACHVPEHSSVDRIYGYQKYENMQELTAAFHRLMQEQLLPLEKQGLSGAVYTQLSDIEEEVNGIVTYDRRIIKIIKQ